MTVARQFNGMLVNITLTPEELEEAYREREIEYYMQDVEGYATCIFTEEEKRKIAVNFRDSLEDSEEYWACYWSCMEKEIEDALN